MTREDKPMMTTFRTPVLLACLCAVADAQELSIDIFYGNRPSEYKVAITGPDQSSLA